MARRARFYLPSNLERQDIIDEMLMITSQRKAADTALSSLRKIEAVTLSPNWPALELELIQARDVMDAAIRDCRLRLLGQLPMQD